MKKLFLATTTLATLASASAYAEINLNVDIGEPAPAYVSLLR